MARLYARRFKDADELRVYLAQRSSDDDSSLPEQELGDDLGYARIEPTEDGWSLTVDGDTTAHKSRDEAFAAVEESEWFAEATGRKHVTAKAYERLAPGRWVDAASTEDLPAAHDGSQVEERMIGEMARNLSRAKTPVLVDGGGVSDPHESAWNPNTKAAGWAFAGIEVRDAEDRAHLWLWLRLHPDVDTQLDEGQTLFGSVLFLGDDTDRYGDGDPIGARLVSYALTNSPFVDGLEPHAPRERAQTYAGRWLAITRSRRIEMPKTRNRPTGKALKKQIRSLATALGLTKSDAPKAWDAAARSLRKLTTDAAKERKAGKRGAALDKLEEVAGLLGVEVEEATEVYGDLTDAIMVLQDAAHKEEILEDMGLTDPTSDVAEEGGDREEDDDEDEESARAEDDDEEDDEEESARAIEGLDTAEAQEAFITDALASLKSIFGQADATAAELLALLKSAEDRLRAAIESADAEGDDPPEGMGEEERAARADMTAMRTQLKKLSAELTVLREKDRRHELNGLIDERARECGHVDKSTGTVALDAERRETIHKLCARAWEERETIVEGFIQQTGMPPGGVTTQPDQRATKGGAPSSQRDALNAVREQLAKEHPDWDKNTVRREASIVAPRRFPQLFKKDFAAA